MRAPSGDGCRLRTTGRAPLTTLPVQLYSLDHNNYVLGRIGTHNGVVACLPSEVSGTISAARVVHQMLATCKKLH